MIFINKKAKMGICDWPNIAAGRLATSTATHITNFTSRKSETNMCKRFDIVTAPTLQFSQSKK